MSTYLRPFSSNDYPALVTIHNAAYPDYQDTVDEVRHRDAHRDPKCKWARWVAERDGHVVGYGGYEQWSFMYHPRKFGISLTVHPEYQGLGVGAALYTCVLDQLEPFEPLAVRTATREDMVRAVRFIAERGFREELHAWESRLDVPSFDFAPYAGVEAKVEAQGIMIKTLRELESDPDRDRKLYDAVCEIDQDLPSPEPVTASSFEHWVESRMQDRGLLPEAYFVALDGTEYVGVSALWRKQADNNMWTGLTGVKRSHRRRGIALALKLRAIGYAKDHGHPVIITDNESTNRPMLSINERLGFVRQPAWIHYLKVLREE